MLKLRNGFGAGQTFLLIALAASLSLTLLGCDYSDDDFDHDPPAGKGTLYVVNRTPNDCNVFVDGTERSGVDADDKEWYDLDPDVRRVVVDQDNTYRVFRGDVDILEGKRTILELSVDPNNLNRFDAFIYFD
jgi:hypothetical protein